MARVLGASTILAAVQTAVAALSAVKTCDIGEWQIPAPDSLQSVLSAAVIQYQAADKIMPTAGALIVEHKVLVTYLRYLDTTTETAGNQVIPEAEEVFNLFAQARFAMPGWTQNTNSIHVTYARPTGLILKPGFLLDNAPIEVVEIPLCVSAEHYDPANPT